LDKMETKVNKQKKSWKTAKAYYDQAIAQKTKDTQTCDDIVLSALVEYDPQCLKLYSTVAEGEAKCQKSASWDRTMKDESINYCYMMDKYDEKIAAHDEVISEKRTIMEREYKDLQKDMKELKQTEKKLKDNSCGDDTERCREIYKNVEKFINNSAAFMKAIACTVIELKIAALGVSLDQAIQYYFPIVRVMATKKVCMWLYGDPLDATEPEDLSTSSVVVPSWDSMAETVNFLAEVGSIGFSYGTDPLTIFDNCWSLAKIFAAKSKDQKVIKAFNEVDVALWIINRVMEALCGYFGTVMVNILREIWYCNVQILNCGCNVPFLKGIFQ